MLSFMYLYYSLTLLCSYHGRYHVQITKAPVCVTLLCAIQCDALVYSLPTLLVSTYNPRKMASALESINY